MLRDDDGDDDDDDNGPHPTRTFRPGLNWTGADRRSLPIIDTDAHARRRDSR